MNERGRFFRFALLPRNVREKWSEGLLEGMNFGKPRNPELGYTETMELAKLSRKGQLSIPKRLLRAMGVEGEAYFLVELAPEGGLLLRPAGVYPLEVYTERRLQELLAEDALTEEERARLAAIPR
ncbi:hypothetical protein YIM730264_13710 [Thermus hydrothermalis]